MPYMCPSNNLGFDKEDEAWDAAAEVERRTGVPIEARLCDLCHKYHVLKRSAAR